MTHALRAKVLVVLVPNDVGSSVFRVLSGDMPTLLTPNPLTSGFADL
jgi:hypothetical protein